jgi:exopolysaccharide biosynthesis polyprenyl glycosylphosphotransferase
MKISDRRRKQALLLAGDALVLYASLFLSLLVRGAGMPSAATWTAHVWPFTLAFAGWLAVFYTAGLYSPDIAADEEVFTRRLFMSVAISTLGTAAMFYLDRGADINPKTLLALLALMALALVRFWRYAYTRLTALYMPKTGVVFLGANATIAEMIAEMERKPHLGFKASLVLDETGEWMQEPPASAAGVPVANERLRLAEAMDSGEAELVVIANERGLPDETRRLLYALLGRRIRYIGLPDFYELLFRRVPLMDIDEAWFLEKIDLRSKRPYLIAKRGIDIFVALCMLAATLPFWPFIALGVKAGSRGPVFFKQARLGRDGELFTILKFRSMRMDRNDFSPTGTSDPRVTRLGAFLRSSRIDELPQTLNILRGDMSFVGPRPERPELAEELEAAIPYYRQRLLVKPGITGWDQVSGEYHSPSAEDTYKKLQYDLYYVKNMSLTLDVSIFFKTIMTVVSRTGR